MVDKKKFISKEKIEKITEKREEKTEKKKPSLSAMRDKMYGKLPKASDMPKKMYPVE